MIFMHIFFCIFSIILGYIFYICRRFFDNITYVLIKYRGRVPAGDSYIASRLKKGKKIGCEELSNQKSRSELYEFLKYEDICDLIEGLIER
jgi:hypothetical protein